MPTLPEAESRYRAVFDAARDAMIVYTPDGIVIEANAAACDTYGYRRDELIGVDARQAVHPDARPLFEEFLRVVGAGGEFHCETVDRRRDGSVFPIEVTGTRFAYRGKPHLMSVIRDITGRKRADEQLRRSHDTFYHLIQNNPFGVYVIDADFRLAEVSRGARKVFEHVPRPLLGRDFAEVLRSIWSEPFASEAVALFRHTLATGAPFSSPSTVELRQDVAKVEAYDWRIERITLPDGRFGVVCYFYDLSERQRYEADRRRADEQLRAQAAVTDTVTSNAAEALYLLDADGLATYANPAAEAMFGWSRAELLGRRLHDVIHYKHPDGRAFPMGDCPIGHCFASGRTIRNHEDLFVHRDGSFVPVLCSMAPILRDGRPAGAVLAVSDVTERRRAEEALREMATRFERHSRLFEQIASTTPDFIYVFDLDGRFLYANRRLLEVWGRTFEDAVGKNLYELGYPQWHAAMHVRELRQVIETKRPIKGEVPFTGGSGISGVYEYIFTPVLGPTGEVEVIAGTTRDVTERRRAEKELEQAKADAEAGLARWRAVVAGMAEGVVVADAQGNLPEWNAAALEMHGYAGLDEVRRHLSDFPEVLELAAADGRAVPLGEWPMSRALRGESFSGCELTVRRLDADLTRVISYSGGPVRDRDGRVTSAVLTLHDVTERKRAERELRHAKEDAERASAAKSEFLSILSHELRTPLTPVLLTTSLMETHPGLPPDLREDVATIRRNVELESRLISDLLDLTRIEKGKLQLDVQDVDLHAAVRSAIDICQREASARLEVDFGAARHTVRGDPTRLQQVFWNLINNAHKFTPTSGTINVRSYNVRERVRVEVRDTGAGIDPLLLPRLFTAFEQGDVRAVRQQAGLGLGLAITRRLVEAHGGTVTATSGGRGNGATFVVELPAVEPAAAPSPVETRAADGGASRPLKVLLVEDHEPTLRILEKLLRRLGHRVTGVSSVASASVAAEQDGFDLIISDLGLPDGSGLDLMRQVRERYAGRAIALTGYGMESDVAASREAGFTEHLTKPVDLAALKAAIGRVSSPPV
jgi:PAS domain S-box-containing protein